MNKMIKVVIAGCGLIAPKKHIPAYKKLVGKVEVVAVCDLNEEAAKRVSQKFNIKKFYTNFTEMLSCEKPDVVDICTPPQTHARLAVEALKSGCHVILEKPMALSLADCNSIIETANRCNKKVGVIHNQIFNPALSKAKELVLKGEIGDFLGVQIFLSTPTDYMTSVKDHWVHKLPGGVLGETGPHSVYLANVFLKNISEVNVYPKKLLSEYPWSTSEDFRIVLIADNGIGSVTQIYGSNQWAANVDIFCTEGILKVDLQNKSLIKYNRTKLNALSLGIGVLDNAFQTVTNLLSTGLSYFLEKGMDAHSVGINNFMNCIIEDKPFPVSGEDGRETVRVMEMLVKKLDPNLKEKLVLK
ncbi:MAG: Gfo/Idh/MocA family oxidoreductase [Candidatus Melainabacteria bacterium]|nr:Gfo/Idh/MocA family oxidoreductase [Candidatus Melainabacteria bacterium]